MLKHTKTVTSFSVDDIAEAQTFYGDVLGLELSAEAGVILLHHSDDQDTLIYPKPDHIPASYTVLNFVVEDIDDAVHELLSRGVRLLRYEGLGTDDKGVVRTPERDIAWFVDTAGNVHSVVRLKTPLPKGT